MRLAKLALMADEEKQEISRERRASRRESSAGLSPIDVAPTPSIVSSVSSPCPMWRTQLTAARNRHARLRPPPSIPSLARRRYSADLCLMLKRRLPRIIPLRPSAHPPCRPRPPMFSQLHIPSRLIVLHRQRVPFLLPRQCPPSSTPLPSRTMSHQESGADGAVKCDFPSISCLRQTPVHGIQIPRNPSRSRPHLGVTSSLLRRFSTCADGRPSFPTPPRVRTHSSSKIPTSAPPCL